MATSVPAPTAGSEDSNPERTGGPIGPVQPRERIQLLDVLRGFALLGILIVNMQAFSSPLYIFVMGQTASTAAIDQAALLFVQLFAQGKFYTLFSFLFGLGFALQFMNAEARGEAKPTRLYRRRVLVLTVIGAIHAFLIWMGDILLLYALMAWPMLLFRKSSPRRLLIWAAIFLLLPSMLMLGFATAIHFGKQIPEARQQIERDFEQQRQTFARETENSYRNYATGTFMEVTTQRARDVKFMYSFMFFFAPSVLGMFLVGLWAGRRQLFRDTGSNLPFFRRVQRWGLVLGVVGNGFGVWAMHIAPMTQPTFLGAAGAFASGIGAPALMMFYASTLVLLWHTGEQWQARLRPIASVGRMALTNYLLQSIVCTMIFYSYGLGFYGRMGMAAGLALTAVIYALQVPWSRWWLSRYQMGPAEWVWRSLTYGRAQKLRLERSAAA